jgi:hypothetical protein
MTRLLPLLPLLLPACSPVGLAGSLDGVDLAFEEVVYIEQSGTDPGSQQPYHDFFLWLMPVADSCAVYDGLLRDLADLRTRMQTDALDATAYCDEWEATFQAAFGAEAFWMANMRLKSLPRPDGVDVTTRYGFWDDAQSAMAEEPNFDGEVARYPAPTFDACAAEFTGDGAVYGPTLHEVDGGEAEVEAYEPTESVTVRLAPTIAGQGDEPLTASTTAEPCLAVLDWPLVVGTGVP